MKIQNLTKPNEIGAACDSGSYSESRLTITLIIMPKLLHIYLTKLLNLLNLRRGSLYAFFAQNEIK